MPKFVGYSKSDSMREVYSNSGLPQQTRNIPNRQPKSTSKCTGKRRTNKAQNQHKEGVIKIRAEINEIETEKTIEKIIEIKIWIVEMINKINKALARLRRKKRKKAQINKIRNERGEIARDTSEIQKIMRIL